MKPKRILIADDEPHMMRVIKLFLERAGYQVETARDGQMALEAILENPPDLLVTDIQMPRMTGQQLCAALEQQLPGRRFAIIVMTSMTDHEHRAWTDAMPNTTFLEKPLSMRLLTASIEQIFGSAQPDSGG